MIESAQVESPVSKAPIVEPAPQSRGHRLGWSRWMHSAGSS